MEIYFRIRLNNSLEIISNVNCYLYAFTRIGDIKLYQSSNGKSENVKFVSSSVGASQSLTKCCCRPQWDELSAAAQPGYRCLPLPRPRDQRQSSPDLSVSGYHRDVRSAPRARSGHPLNGRPFTDGGGTVRARHLSWDCSGSSGTIPELTIPGRNRSCASPETVSDPAFCLSPGVQGQG